jgi:hypothetical protein
MASVGARVQARQQRQELRGRQVADDAHVEQTIVEDGARRDSDAAAIRWSIGHGDAERAPLENLAVEREAHRARPERGQRPQDASKIEE